MSELLLDVKNLKTVYTSDFETVHAVNGISFTLNKGETLGIVGETGSGKTTTALSIMRLLPAISGKILEGSITYEGKDLLKATAAVCGIFGTKRSVGLVKDYSGAMGLLLAMTGACCFLLLVSLICFLKGVG